MVDRNRPARYEVGGRAALKATGQTVEILEVRRGEFVPNFVYKVRVLAERPARPYNLPCQSMIFQTERSEASGIRFQPWGSRGGEKMTGVTASRESSLCVAVVLGLHV